MRNAVATPIDFYFEFASPYGYFASLRIEALAGRFGRVVTWRPIMLGAAFKRTGMQPTMSQPLRCDYFLRDIERFARLLEAPFRRPAQIPMNSLAASRAYYWTLQEEARLAVPLAKAVFQAHWGEGRNLSTPEEVIKVAAPLGLPADALFAAVQDPAVKQRLRDETEAAIERGVFGSPFIVVDGEPFWGADRLDQVERWLETGGW